MLKKNVRSSGQLAIHDFRIRYARSYVGPLWLIMTPVALLGIYGLVFGVVLQVQWPSLPNGAPVGFVVPFFCGLSVFLFFSDVASSSPNIFSNKRNFVKKSTFPLWVLWLSNFLRACIQGGVYLLLALITAAATNLLSVAGLLYAITVVIGILIFCAAVSLFLASVGPFLGDIAEVVRVALRLMFYSAPITYPLSLVPAPWQIVLWLNPLTHMIEPLRTAIMYGQSTNWWQLLAFTTIAMCVLAASWWLFARISKAIPDVI